jgi:hypothetical protein
MRLCAKAPIFALPIKNFKEEWVTSTIELKLKRLPVGTRLAAAAAALAATASICAAMLLSFHSASPQQWLAPSPELMEAAAGCELLATRETRDGCKQALVTAGLEARKGPVRVAQR